MAVPKKKSASSKSKKNANRNVVKKEDIGENVGVSEDIKSKENSTLIWFFAIVIFVFALVLVPYFWNESSKVFEFGGIDWVIEEYEYLEIFHGRFVSLTNPNLNYNVFFRTDPRTNDVEISGKLDRFKYGGIISLSSEVDSCRGDLSRVMLDLAAFLKQGVGVGVIESASNDLDIANATGRKFVDCENVLDRTVVIIDIGERGFIQDEANPYCYTIYAEDCEDSGVVEKFMMQSVIDFRETHGSYNETKQ